MDMSDRLPEARSAHEGMCHFLTADGAVRAIRETVDRRVYGYLFTIQGREVIGATDF